MKQNIFKYNKLFRLESGSVLPELRICYTAYGKMNSTKDNVVWIMHALTGNSDPVQWWEGLVGNGKLFDTEKYFIVCANNIGSCYGSTGPESINPETGNKYGKHFPFVTVRDIVSSNEILRKHLGINNIFLLTGGSLGGQICLEWSITKPELFSIVVPLAANSRHSAWGIAFNETQRMALACKNGIETARAVAMLSYRCYKIFENTQTNNDNRIDDFSASSYQRYQGLKLRKRFSKYSYYVLSKAMDSHNIGRGRGGIIKALNRIKAKVLIIGIKSDLLFPVSEQKFIADNIHGAKLKIIDSDYGHDGFLVEHSTIAKTISNFLKTLK
ncbi:MAG: homoserine O-acetyltransferase [Ignavibacteria bacterium]|nr:homoserine O-acetyltransferase [Ignavibacteria bacterium]